MLEQTPQCGQTHTSIQFSWMGFSKATMHTSTSHGSMEPHNFAVPHYIILLQHPADEVRYGRSLRKEWGSACILQSTSNAPMHWRRDTGNVENTTILKNMRHCFYHACPTKLLCLMDITTRPWSNMNAKIITVPYLSLMISMTGKFLERSLYGNDPQVFCFV